MKVLDIREDEESAIVDLDLTEEEHATIVATAHTLYPSEKDVDKLLQYGVEYMLVLAMIMSEENE